MKVEGCKILHLASVGPVDRDDGRASGVGAGMSPTRRNVKSQEERKIIKKRACDCFSINGHTCESEREREL